MGIQKVVITGGPGTGKSTLIKALQKLNYKCLDEISRAVIQEAQKQGISQLFLEQPLYFSELLLKGRLEQFTKADSIDNSPVFFDRGIPDVIAYLDYLGHTYPDTFSTTATQNRYTIAFILEPWEAIYTTDNERYESFEQAQRIHKHIVNTYANYQYTPISVPFGTVQTRVDFILNTLQLK